MKHVKLLFLAALVLLVTGCEKEKPIYKIAFLSQIELTSIPENGLYYSCIEINTANPLPQYTHTFVTPEPITKRDLPITWTIRGGQRLDKEDEIHAFSIVSIDEAGNSTILLMQPVQTFVQLKMYGYPDVLNVVENGVVCKLHFLYY